MCQSPAATAVCMASEPLSVIVRRGPESDRTLAEHARLIDTTRYSRIVEPRSRGLASATLRSAIVPSVGVDNQQEKASRSQVASSLAERGQVFQVKLMGDTMMICAFNHLYLLFYTGTHLNLKDPAVFILRLQKKEAH